MNQPDCKSCWFRIMVARAFDIHIDHNDCWEDCERIHASPPIGESKCSSSTVRFPNERGEEHD
jgi:hypothetical protein